MIRSGNVPKPHQKGRNVEDQLLHNVEAFTDDLLRPGQPPNGPVDDDGVPVKLLDSRAQLCLQALDHLGHLGVLQRVPLTLVQLDDLDAHRQTILVEGEVNGLLVFDLRSTPAFKVRVSDVLDHAASAPEQRDNTLGGLVLKQLLELLSRHRFRRGSGTSGPGRP